jgi:hypothetical protein
MNLAISLAFFHAVPKLVQALVVTYDETFQALAAEGDVLLPKPFLHPGFDGVVRRMSPGSEMLFLYRQGFENLVVRCDKCVNKVGDCMDRYRTDVQTYSYAFFLHLSQFT